MSLHSFLRIVCCLGLMGGLWGVRPAQAADKIEKAIQAFLKGQSLEQAKRYRQALKAYEKAYRYVPRIPRFNCRRSTFLQYQGRVLRKMRRPYKAMRRYYKAAYRSGCRSSVRKAAARWYQSLDRRWMCYLTITTTPPKARVISMTTKGETLTARTPMLKKRMIPGRYRFKIRLYDHR
ncbi:MAG: hypothetical protein AAGJ35_09820, partial [Myxococcota bacterium]